MDDITALAVSPAKGAALLGVSRSKFYELLNEEIPALKLGRRTLVRVADIQRFLELYPRSSGEWRPEITIACYMGIVVPVEEWCLPHPRCESIA